MMNTVINTKINNLYAKLINISKKRALKRLKSTQQFDKSRSIRRVVKCHRLCKAYPGCLTDHVRTSMMVLSIFMRL